MAKVSWQKSLAYFSAEKCARLFCTPAEKVPRILAKRHGKGAGLLFQQKK
jgi:hypothetical protein